MRFAMAPVMILAAVLMTATPDVASAQPPLQKDTWLVSGALGLAIDADGSGSLTIDGAAAYPLTRDLAVEGELGHVFDMAPGNVNVDSSLTTFHATALYFINTSYVLTPYLAAGIGAGKYSVESNSSKFSTTEIGFNLGAGATYPIGKATYFRGDFRYFKHIDDVPSIWRFTGGIAVRIGS